MNCMYCATDEWLKKVETDEKKKEITYKCEKCGEYYTISTESDEDYYSRLERDKKCV